MYILLEASRSDPSSIYDWDCMGYATSESAAIDWVCQNSEYRTYKYCPKKEV